MNVVESENVLGLRSPVLVVILGSFVLGGLFFAIGYIVIKLGRRNKNADTAENSGDKDDRKSTDEHDSATSESGPGANTTITNSKRARKKRREAQQEFNHSWMVGALKGHSAPVLDMNFSSNGKFLASCAEDCGLMPEEELDLMKSSKKSKASASSSPTKEREDRTPLSRRQRKNRTRAPRDQRRELQDEDNNDSPNDSPLLNRNRHHWLQRHDRHYQDAPARSTTSSTKESKKQDSAKLGSKETKNSEKTKSKSTIEDESSVSASKSKKFCSSTQRDELKHLDDVALECLLRSYCLNTRQMIHGGYPIPIKGKPNCALIYGYQGLVNHRTRSQHHLDANAREFVPASTPSSWNAVESEADSGNGSGSSVENSDLEQESSSDSDKCSDISESSSSSSGYQDQCISSDAGISKRGWECVGYKVQRKCVRCFRPYHVDPRNGDYLEEEQCVYHWGKRKNGSWECCRTRQYDEVWGCTTAKMHVWTGIIPGVTNGPLEGYISTRPLGRVPENRCYGVYGLDCEMCFTNNGLELAKVSVVSLDGTLVYNEFVKPEAEVIDYCTRFSGLTAKDVASATKTLKDVQKDLLKFIHSETILIGHGLENDLRVLRILHNVVVDTSFAFPHDLGLPYRRSLKTLAQFVLGKEIQTDTHDSIEDAGIAMELMLRRLQLDLYDAAGEGVYLCMKQGLPGISEWQRRSYYRYI